MTLRGLYIDADVRLLGAKLIPLDAATHLLHATDHHDEVAINVGGDFEVRAIVTSADKNCYATPEWGSVVYLNTPPPDPPPDGVIRLYGDSNDRDVEDHVRLLIGVHKYPGRIVEGAEVMINDIDELEYRATLTFQVRGDGGAWRGFWKAKPDWSTIRYFKTAHDPDGDADIEPYRRAGVTSDTMRDNE